MEDTDCNGLNEGEISTRSNNTNINNNINNVQLQNNPEQKVNNIQASNYNRLVSVTRKIYEEAGYYDLLWYNKECKDEDKQEIKNYLADIKEFYKSNDTNTLPQLTQVVHEVSCQWNGASMQHNLSDIRRLLTTDDEYNEFLRFVLFLELMTDIEHYDALVQPDVALYLIKPNEDEAYKYKLIEYDGIQVWIDLARKESNYGSSKLWNDIRTIIRAIADSLIPKYFVLNNTNTWITRDELESRIKNDIRNICNYFDSLPIVKQILQSKNIKSTYDSIPENSMNVYISDAINDYFKKQEVKTKLKEEANKYFKEVVPQKQINRAYKESKLKGIKSQYIFQKIVSYIGPRNNKKLKSAESFQDLVKHYRIVPNHSDFRPDTIHIVNSYLNPKNKKYNIDLDIQKVKERNNKKDGKNNIKYYSEYIT